MIGAAAVAVGANAATQVVTNTVDGIRWKILIDTEAKTAQLGLNSAAYDGGSWEANTAIPLDTPAKVTVPTNFVVNGENYAVTRIDTRAFYNESFLVDMTFQDNIERFDNRCLANCSALKNVLIKGPSTVLPGLSQTYMSTYFGSTNNWSSFHNCSSLKLIVVGPNVKFSSNLSHGLTPKGANGATVLFPYNSGNTTWSTHTDSYLNAQGLNNKAVFYGPDYDFDMTMGETAMTFYPKTETALTNIISWASTFKSAFDMDTKIAITNRIEMSEGVQITEAMLQNVTLEAPPWYLTFAVKNQSQLDNVLAAVSADVPIIIDIDGAGKNQITVPNGRKVAILAKSGWTFGKKLNGLIISFF